MLTLTFAGDEAGDVSFAFADGASRSFAVAVIATPRPDDLRTLLATLRQDSGLAADFEFRFHTLSSPRLRQRVLTRLADADFSAWALVADKTFLPDTFRVLSSLDFYLYFVTELIRTIPPVERKGATLILDEFGSPSRLRMELNRVLTLREIPREFKRVLVKRSRSEPLLQVADLIAGAVLRRDTKRDSEAFDYLTRRIRQVTEFRG